MYYKVSVIRWQLDPGIKIFVIHKWILHLDWRASYFSDACR